MFYTDGYSLFRFDRSGLKRSKYSHNQLGAKTGLGAVGQARFRPPEAEESNISPLPYILHHALDFFYEHVQGERFGQYAHSVLQCLLCGHGVLGIARHK